MSHPDLEIGVLAWLASFAGRWPLLDRLAATIAHNDLFEGIPYVLVLVGFWYADRADAGAARRREVLAGCLAAAVAVLVSRIVQNAIPSARPIWSPAHASLFPPEFHQAMDPSFHSFPSDHVAFLLPLAHAVYRLDAALGAIGAVWLVIVSLVRAYLGLHYPVDLVGGAALGILAIWTVRAGLASVVDRALAGARRADARWPGPTAAAVFLIAFQYATLFALVRDLGHRVFRLWTMLGSP